MITQGRDARYRAADADAVGKIGPRAAFAVPALVAALEDEGNDECLQRAAAVALGAIGPEAH